MYTNKQGRRCCKTLKTPYSVAAKTIPAGEGCMSECAKTGLICGMKIKLAQVESPIQEYRTGFCPCNALQQGTYFPELVK